MTESTATPAAVAAAWLRCAAAAVHERRLWLTELDAAIGDGDHGINLDRGLQAVVAELDATGAAAAEDVGTLLGRAGRRLLGLVGGASGALYGRGLMSAGERLRAVEGPAAPGAGEPLDAVGLTRVALEGAIDGITALGRSGSGDKTMLDALVPALAVLRDPPPGGSAAEVMRAAADAAEAGAQATVPLVARRGRASYLGERSAGHLDPGAASSALMLRCLADTVGAAGSRREG